MEPIQSNENCSLWFIQDSLKTSRRVLAANASVTHLCTRNMIFCLRTPVRRLYEELSAGKPSESQVDSFKEEQSLEKKKVVFALSFREPGFVSHEGPPHFDLANIVFSGI